jgi:hypothetical protein
MNDTTPTSQLNDAAGECVRKEFPPLDGPARLIVYMTQNLKLVSTRVEALPIPWSADPARPRRQRPEFDAPT